MKALSIRQPWAWLILHGKNIENRTWKTNFRGSVVIHASKGMTSDEYLSAMFFARNLGIQLPDDKELHRGGIVGMATIVDCVDRHPSPWFQGPYGLVLENVMSLEFIPCKGALGFFQLPADIEDQVRGRKAAP